MRLHIVLIIFTYSILFSCGTRQGGATNPPAQVPPSQPATQACTGTVYQGVCYTGEDTDKDGANDPLEKAVGSDPLNQDSDGDGANDLCEILKKTDPRNKDQKPENCDFMGNSGNNGKAGASCWDLNGNGIPDTATEDSNKDNEVNIHDCRIKENCDAGEQGCTPCKKDNEGKCVVIKNSCGETTIPRAKDCVNKCEKNCKKQGGDCTSNCTNLCNIPINIPIQSDCTTKITPPASYKEIKIKVTACVSGYHVLTPTLHSLSWQTLNIYDIYDEENFTDDGAKTDIDGTIGEEGNPEIGLAEHCQESGINNYFNNAKISIDDADDVGWTYPAFDSYDLWEKLKNKNINTAEPYFIEFIRLEAGKKVSHVFRMENNDEIEESIITPIVRNTSSSNGQIKTMIQVIVLDDFWKDTFDPIAEITFKIHYAEQQKVEPPANAK